MLVLPEKSIGGVGGAVMTTATGRYITGYDLVMGLFQSSKETSAGRLKGERNLFAAYGAAGRTQGWDQRAGASSLSSVLNR